MSNYFYGIMGIRSCFYRIMGARPYCFYRIMGAWPYCFCGVMSWVPITVSTVS